MHACTVYNYDIYSVHAHVLYKVKFICKYDCQYVLHADNTCTMISELCINASKQLCIHVLYIYSMNIGTRTMYLCVSMYVYISKYKSKSKTLNDITINRYVTISYY